MVRQRIATQIIHEGLGRRQTLAYLLLLAVHAELSLVDLVFQVIYVLHYPVRLLPQLGQERDILQVVVVHVLDQVGLDHAAGDRVGFLDAPFKFHLQLLVLEEFLLRHRILPLQSR